MHLRADNIAIQAIVAAFAIARGYPQKSRLIQKPVERADGTDMTAPALFGDKNVEQKNRDD